jgi:Putative transmembrane protein (PGPGW)
VLAGIVMSGPGVPGPGIATIIVGLGFLALEFDWAERWMERLIIWGDRAIERAEAAPRWQKVLTTTVGLLALAGFAVAAILWDIPLVPVL